MDFLFDTPSPPPPPDYSSLAKVSEKLGLEALDISRQQLEQAKRFGEEQLALARPIAQTQAAMMEEARQRAADQWEQYKRTFQPIEERIAAEAAAYDSPERMARVAQRAQADVVAAAARQAAATDRDLMRFGVNPASGKFLAARAAQETTAPLAEAAAMNAARENLLKEGMSYRSGVAAFGRGQPTITEAFTRLAANTGSSAANTMNSTIGSMMTAQGTAPQWMGSALGGIGQAGNILIGGYGAQVNAYDAAARAAAQEAAGFGQLLGMAVGRMFPVTSDREAKRDVRPVSGESVLEGLKEIPIDSWRYKRGVEDGGAERHVGPYAQDMQRVFGEGAAPGGKFLDLATVTGLTMAAVKELADKMDRLENQPGLAFIVRRDPRDTEPTRKK